MKESARAIFAKIFQALRIYGKSRLAVMMSVAAAVILLLGLIAITSDARQMVTLEFDGSMPYDQAEASRMLSKHGIPSQIGKGGLKVPGDMESQARSILATSSPAETAVLPELAKYAGTDHIWQTEAQNKRQWQAAKMAALSRLVSKFPSIDSAEVLLEFGREAKIGRKEIPPSAVVNVSPCKNSELSQEQVAAICDLVSGSIAGLVPEDVRIIDTNGKSYANGSAGITDPAVAGLPARRHAEQYYGDKIRSVLQYIDGVTVSATVGNVADESTDADDYMCRNVTVSVPQDYFQQVAKGRFGQQRADEVNLEEVISSESQKIKKLAAAALNIKPDNVLVNNYYRQSTPAVIAGGSENPAASVNETAAYGWYVALGLAGAGIIGAITFLALRIKKYRPRNIAGVSDRYHGRLNILPLTNGDICFEDVVCLPVEQLRAVIRSMAVEQLALALRTAEEHVTRRIYEALPRTDARRLKKRVRRLGPVRLGDIENAQQHVVHTLVSNDSQGTYVPQQSQNAAEKSEFARTATAANDKV